MPIGLAQGLFELRRDALLNGYRVSSSTGEQRKSAPEQLDIVRDASDHIVALQERHEIIPYMESGARYGGVIHTWGYSSVAAGLLEAALLLPDRRDAYHAVARRVCHWLIDNAWTGKDFHAVGRWCTVPDLGASWR